jgi:glycolate oxidase
LTAPPTVERDRAGGAALAREFLQFLPPAAVLSEDEDLRPYECDGLTAYRQMPMLAVLPETIEQVQEVMRRCSARGIPVVARGAGTGLSGGALPLADGVLLSLARFNRILDIDPAARTARVQPGVRNLAISEAGTLLPRSPAASAATWRRTPAGCTA